MARTISILLATILTVTTADAGDGFRPHPLRKSIDRQFRLFEAPTEALSAEADATYDAISDRMGNRFNVRPFFSVLPTDSVEPGDVKPPMFSLVARASGGTLVSLTRPGAAVDPGDRLFLQRTLVPNLFERHRFSVTVYEDHVLDGSALRFVGVGARLMARPKLRVFGWGLRFQMFGSFHPEHGATAYFAITGRRDDQPGPSPAD